MVVQVIQKVYYDQPVIDDQKLNNKELGIVEDKIYNRKYYQKMETLLNEELLKKK